MSVALIDQVLLRILSDPRYTAKGSSLTWTEEDTNFKIIADAILELAAVGANSGFAPYDNSTPYSDGDYVSYNNNIYHYINAVDQSGITPGSDPLTWELSSVGQFAHQQNTDQYLDFGGPFQVSAEDLYNLVTAPPFGDVLFQGTNPLTEPLFLLGDQVLLGDEAGGNIQINNVDGTVQIANSTGDGIQAYNGKIFLFTNSGTPIGEVGTGLIYLGDLSGAGLVIDNGAGNASLVNNTGDGINAFDGAVYTIVNSTSIITATATEVTYSVPLILNADPVTALGAATKAYVDNIATGITWKNSVVAGTTANITLSGAQTIDGISVIAGDRVLVKNQSTVSQNGLYLCAAGAWTRTLDADTGPELAQATVLVEGGTANGGTQWNCSNTTITIGSTSVTFVQIAGAGVYTNGTGLSLTGNVFSIDSTVVTLTGSQALSNKTGNISQWTNNSGYLTSSTGVTTVNGASGAITNVALTTGTLAQFAATTSAQLAGIISDETGSGALVFGTSPTLVAPVFSSGTTFSGNISANAWGLSGINIKQPAFSVTDLTSSGTVTAQCVNYWGAPTINASNATTFTTSYANYMEAPIAGSGPVIQTVRYALGLGGNLNMNVGNIFFTGVAGIVGTSDSNTFSVRSGGTNRTTWSTQGAQTHTMTAQSSGTNVMYTMTQPDHTGGTGTLFSLVGGALTNQTANVAVTDIKVDLSAVLKMADGTVAAQPSVVITGRTYTPQTTALTLTVASTLDVVQSIAGSGTTIGSNYTQRWLFNSNNYAGLTIGSTGNASFSLTGTSPVFSFLNPSYFSDNIATSSTVANANFFAVRNTSTGPNTTQAELNIGGTGTIYSRVWLRGSTNITPAAGTNYASLIVGQQAVTIAGSGTHAVFANALFRPLSITAGAGTATISTTVYIEGSATGAVNNYSLLAGGNVRFDANLRLATGTTTTAPLTVPSGTLKTTAAAGEMEYNGTNLFFTRTGTTRESVFVGDSGAAAPATTALPSFTSYYGTSAAVAMSTPNSWASVVIGGTTYKIPLYT